MNFLKFNKIVITKVALILNVRKFILYIEYTCRHAVASSSKQVLPVNSFIYIYTTYRVHSLEKYSIFSTSTVIDQKTRSVHIYVYIIIRLSHAPCLHFTVDIQSGVSSVFAWHTTGRRIASQSKQTVRGGPKPAKVGLHRRLSGRKIPASWTRFLISYFLAVLYINLFHVLNSEFF